MYDHLDEGSVPSDNSRSLGLHDLGEPGCTFLASFRVLGVARGLASRRSSVVQTVGGNGTLRAGSTDVEAPVHV